MGHIIPDYRFLIVADLKANLWSKDPKHKVCAIIVDNKGRSVGHGYNGFPRNIDDTHRRYQDKNIKNLYIVHAEQNAILNSTSSLENCTLYSNYFPCNVCAQHIIQSGISNLVSYSIGDTNSRGVQIVARDMLKEAGVIVHEVDYEYVEENFYTHIPYKNFQKQ